MTEAILGVAFEKLSSLVGKELGRFLGFDRDMERLQSMFTAIKATLEDAEEKQFSSRTIKDWLQKLKDVALKLDDIMDECAYEELSLSNQVQSSCLSSFNPKHVVFRHKMSKKMERIKERLDEIAKEKEQLHLTERTLERRSEVRDWRQTFSSITEPQVYGRENDKNKIVDFMVGDASHSDNDLVVYPIKGPGGLGKTTLAQLVFNHERVVKHFELKIWVCVSEDFSLKRMIKSIIQAASGDACGDLELEPLQKKLHDLLQRKKYLLVLDDVWDEEQENWNRLKSVLSCGAKGTFVLVTTRLTKVATIMGTTDPHELSMLSDGNCWELFKHRAFGSDEVIQVEHENIGKEIVKKCGGLPLAATALGGLLRFERKEEAWLNVKESNVWSSSDNIMPALILSYLNLPIKLRQCFAYCAIFPKDERIEKQYLIELWMANGFISSNGMLNAQDVGDDVWHELHWRSLFQDLEIDELGKVTSFKLHDLVHDLAQSVAEEICCITRDTDVTTLSKRIYHLSDSTWGSHQLPKVKSLRTCIMLNYLKERFHSSVLKFYSLRVLDFVNRNKLSSSIGNLKHLRYLNLSYGKFKTLPESLCELWNLQILKLDRCNDLQKFPNSLIWLKALHQLSLSGCYSLSSLPPHIGKMSSLRSLTMYIVGKESGFLLEELEALNLKGELFIKNMEKVKSVMDAKKVNMSNKKLNLLRFKWARNEEFELQNNVEQILEVLQPDTQQLQRLIVTNYKGVHFPQWMSSPSLKYLNSLELDGCRSSLHLPVLGKLPSLRDLTVSDMTQVEYLYEESYDDGVVFLALEYLSLSSLPNLVRLSREYGENMFPHLSKLYISECPKLWDGMLQNLASLETLEIRNLSNLEVLPTEIFNHNVIESLYLRDCENLQVLIQGLHSLEKLEIRSCRKFSVSAGLQHLTCLQYLSIGTCDVEGLHYALQHMTSLKKLSLRNLPNLESLPDCFGNLPLLQRLQIDECSKLRCLPTSLSLSKLERLYICNCPMLKKRCEKETGEDWSKIAHIHDVVVW
uniref:Disease resistance protein RGA3 n=1 Tax=Cajanus cajan TaxID=3821 RepID=A0A151RH66_CAJCA|nr:Putative disease resistance protein RGA3 [Cajanus cajan]